MKTKFIGLLLVILGFFQGHLAYGQGAYPDKVVRLIVPQAAGGPSDVIGRLLAQKLSESLGKSVIVDNKPGAGGNIGVDATAKAKPDGYVMIVTIVSVDLLFFRHHTYARLMANVGIVLLSLAFYWRYFKRN